MQKFTALLVALPLFIAAGTGCGDEGAGGKGGDGAQGGGGSGGQGGEDGTPVVGPLDPDAALKAAIFIGSCVPDDGINRILHGLYTERGPNNELFAAFAACFADKANGCQAVADCVGIQVDLGGPCTPSCNGDVLTVCDDALRFQVDCAKPGLSCSQEAGGCVKLPLGATCDPAYNAECVDGAPSYCDFDTSTVSLGPKCADYGLSCNIADPGDWVCAGTGASCIADATSPLQIDYSQGLGCDGDTLRACVNGGEHMLDCSTIATGATCQQDAAGSFCGFDTACDPAAGMDATCNGDSVVVCHAGRVETVDCKTLGFTGCEPMFGVCIPSIYG